MFAVKLMNTEFVVLNSSDVINEALVQKGTHMQARPNDAWKIQVADFDRRLQQYLQRPV
jgi:hypothetical protein